MLVGEEVKLTSFGDRWQVTVSFLAFTVLSVKAFTKIFDLIESKSHKFSTSTFEKLCLFLLFTLTS